MTTTLWWIRRDLRVADNAALARALERHSRVVPVYVHAPEEEAPWSPGAASRWWLHHSLAALSDALKKRGSGLVIRTGPTTHALLSVAREVGAAEVVWNRLYEPRILERDRSVDRVLRQAGIATQSFRGHLLFEPDALRTGEGRPYRVFTPFWRACQRDFPQLSPALPAPPRLPDLPKCHSLAMEDLGLLPRVPWDSGLRGAWSPGEQSAGERLQAFSDEQAGSYAQDRNLPGVQGSSRLSPHLHFGEITPHQVLASLQATSARKQDRESLDTYVRELGWREFAHHLLFHFPHTAEHPLDQRFEQFAWRRNSEALAAWQRGATGIPLVDAGMRELWRTGWMHNRVRMIAASFLVKNLRISWLEGARWFWDTLVDADLANNTLGWQWTAGCGADAAPYVRVFNPVLQAERFDPDRRYLRRWLPERAAASNQQVHRPEGSPGSFVQPAPGEPAAYPGPIVDLAASRTAALAAYQEMRRRAG